MLSYTHFTQEERICLQELLAKDYSMRRIAAILGRNVSSVSREIKRNKSKHPKKSSNNKYQYHAWRAQVLTIVRRKEKKRNRLEPDTKAWNYVVEKLNLYWSPEQISNRWKIDHPEEAVIGTSTIYRYIAKRLFQKISRKTHLRRHGKKKVSKDSNYNTIHPDRIIPQWPDVIKNRERIGDWEGDTVYGSPGKGLLVTQVDRKSRILAAALIPSRNAVITKNAIVNLLKDYPVHSISLDNGSEFAEFKSIETELKTEVYFAEPHKPWQRGSNENTNDLIRFFFPKGFDFTTVTQDDIDYVVNLINNRPRKTLGWKTPFEVFSEDCVALT